MSRQEIFDYLKGIGCCTVCCLRFLKARGNEYENVEETLQKLGVKHTKSDEKTELSEPALKKSKSNVCIACLNFFSDDFLGNLVASVTSNSDLAKYECDEYVLAISFPVLLSTRQLSIWLALIDKFSASISTTKPPDVPLKEASKLVVNPKMTKSLNRKYGQDGIMINISISHENEAIEMEKLQKVDEILFRKDGKAGGKKRRPKGASDGVTRSYFERTFLPDNVDVEVYKEHVSVPPEATSSGLMLEKISLTGPTIFVAGRYQKFSRQLPHTPWILKGKRIMEDSIQELIIRSVGPYFGVPLEKIIFSSSGREDVDVRCLGRGRPFVLEIPDSKRTALAQSIAEQMELEIDRTEKISVINLQIVEREELVHIKTGEEKKRKSYRALCTLKEPATVEVMEKLNVPDGFTIHQWTPIRVLHRRPLHNRPRQIYSMKAYVLRDNHLAIVLDVVTQAGTYIKELVHGDFNRTKPNLTTIIGQDIDIIALDVLDIDLDWPKAIDNRISAKNENDEVVE